MMAIKSSFVFIICVLETILTVDCIITDEEKHQLYSDILMKHNDYRKKHDQKLLKWDDTLSQLARVAVYQILYEKIYIPSEIYGMNHYTGFVAMGYKLNVNEASMIMTQWYNKGINYNYTKEPSIDTADTTDSFTQIVWSNTKKLGAAMMTKEGVIGVVVLYEPRGNIIGEYMMNVKEPKNVGPLNE